DPNLVNPLAFDFRLLLGSPAIDAGLNLSFSTYDRLSPASMAGLPRSRRKSNANGFTRFGSVLLRLFENVAPVVPPVHTVPFHVRLFATVTFVSVPPLRFTPAVVG